MNKNITCCFTGHRIIPDECLSQLQNELDTLLESLIEKGYRNFCSGGALGFDLLAAQRVIKFKNQYENISLSMILPCQNQDKFWNSTQKQGLVDVLKVADEIIYTSESYFKGCMYRRNRFLVDASSCMIAYLEKNSGGTKYTVSYAEKKGVPVFFLNTAPEQLTLFS